MPGTVKTGPLKAFPFGFRTLTAFGFAAMLAAGAARADDSADRSAVQSIISQQMDAFKRDDGPAAFAFASEGLKQIFHDPTQFLAMVRSQYQAVYRPKKTQFGAFKIGDGHPSQTVEIIDSQGQAWTAVYSFAKDASGHWQITGCALIKNPETSA